MLGVEVACRPILYTRASFCDTDIKTRLVPLGHISEKNLPSARESFARKLLSRCSSYAEDFALQCLIFDIVMARELTSLVNMATAVKASPGEFASGNQAFSKFWEKEQHKLEDICRQHDRMPNLFFTIAPAEWKFHCLMACSAITI